MALASLYSGLKSPIPSEYNIGQLLIYMFFKFCSMTIFENITINNIHFNLNNP